jgi:hypothetical protein
MRWDWTVVAYVTNDSRDENDDYDSKMAWHIRLLFNTTPLPSYVRGALDHTSCYLLIVHSD